MMRALSYGYIYPYLFFCGEKTLHQMYPRKDIQALFWESQESVLGFPRAHLSVFVQKESNDRRKNE